MTQARKFQLALDAMGIHEDSSNRAEYYTVIPPCWISVLAGEES